MTKKEVFLENKRIDARKKKIIMFRRFRMVEKYSMLGVNDDTAKLVGNVVMLRLGLQR